MTGAGAEEKIFASKTVKQKEQMVVGKDVE